LALPLTSFTLHPCLKNALDSDTYSNGKGSTVAKVVDGSVDQHELSGMAGVANIGNDLNWCGHPFAQANWFALGKTRMESSTYSRTNCR
jgi:alpha-glucuronidase